MKNSNLGIVITTYAGCFYLTKALLASIKKFMPHLPICIIKDGTFDISNDIRPYNVVSIIEREDVQNDFLRDNCFGSRCTNMIAFWESPFEYFLYLDSDAVIWGDIVSPLGTLDCDFIYNTPHEAYTDYILKTQYFDFDRVFKLIENIDYRKHHFFNAGVFVAKKGIFNLDLFKQLFIHNKETPGILGPGPQGIINYLVFLGVEKGTMDAKEVYIQEVLPVCSVSDLNLKYNIADIDKPIEQPIVLHWAGIKPIVENRDKVLWWPQLYFRKLHLRNVNSFWINFPLFRFWLDEKMALLHVYYKGSIILYFKTKAHRILKVI